MASDNNNPIVGDWRLVNGSYSCDAVFAPIHTGRVTCGILGVGETRTFNWQQGNQSQYTLTDDKQNEVMTQVSDDGMKMTSDIFPAGSYLQKVNY